MANWPTVCRDVDVVEERVKSVRRVKSSSGLEQRLMLA